MRGDDAPALREADPRLALSSTHWACSSDARKLKRDAGEITVEAHDIETRYGACEVCRRATFAEVVNFFIFIKIFGNTEAHDLWRHPKHLDQLFHIIGYERLFIQWIERA